MKKLIAFIFVFIFFLQSFTVFSASVEEIIGSVMEVHGDIIYIVGESFSDNEYSDVLIRLGDAPVYDLRTGFRAAPYIEEDMDIRAAFTITGYEPFDAVVVWLNWSDDDAAVFTVVASENINIGEDYAVFLSADEKYRVALTEDTAIIDPIHGFISPCDIVPGMEFFVWVDMITASTPALVYPDKVVVVY